MQLQLKRPICFFDLETTGVNIAKDRIVEISILKAFPDGSEKEKTWLVNPELPIPAEATAVQGQTKRYQMHQHLKKFRLRYSVG